MPSLFARTAKVLALILLFASGGAATAAPDGQLTLLTWADYIDPAVLKDFEQESGIHVRVIVFADDQERDKRLVANDGGNYDVVCLNHSVVSSYVASGWLAPATRRVGRTGKRLALLPAICPPALRACMSG